MTYIARPTGRVVPPGELLAELTARLEAPQPRLKTGRRRQRRLLRLTGGVGLVMTMMFASLAFAVHDETFELDGNTAPDAGSAPPIDWESIFTDSTPATVGGVTVGTLPAGYVDAAFVEDWRMDAGAFDTSDGTTFATGSKDTLEINTGWACVGSNNVNNKTDITNAYATIVEDASGRILYFGLEKGEDNGNNNVGLWLLQNDVSCPPDSDPPGTDFSGVHADGDLFIVAAFTNGGGVSNITAYQWSTALGGIDPTPVASSADCQGPQPLADDRLCATTNAAITGGTEFEPAWTHFSSKLGINNGLELATFFEGGIELDGFDEFEDSCFTGFIFNTRSSQELGATLFDYAQGDIDTCAPELKIDKEPETQTHNVGDSFSWTLTVTNDGDGPATDALVEDTIPDGLTIDSVTVSPVSAGSCVVSGQDIDCTVDVAASDGDLVAPEPDVVTITVNVTSTLDVFGTSTDGCVSVNNTGTVSHADDTSTGDDSDTVTATICRPLVSKTAAGSFTHDVQWTIEKSVDPDAHTMNAGQNADSTYTVTVTKTVQDSGFAVTGNITIQNPNPEDSMTVDVVDALSSGESLAATAIDCPGTDDGDDLVVPAASSVVCTYTLNPADATAGTNTATVTLNSLEFPATAPYTFTANSTGEPETINVNDDFEGDDTDLGSASSTTTFPPYTHNFECPTDETQYDASGHLQFMAENTASIVETTGDEDSETVVVDCYIPTVVKDAAGSFTHGVDWTIEKSVDIDQHTMLAGENADSTYTVTATKTVTDANFAVTGTITIGNPNPEDAMTVDVTDELSSGQAALATDIECEGGVDGDNLVVAAGTSIDCTYTLNPADATAGTNTATVTFSADSDVSVSDVADYTFTATNTGEPETVDVQDDFDGTVTALGSISATTTFATYTHNFECPTDETQYDSSGHYEFTKNNTASIVQTDDSDSESVDTDCYIPTITKSADGSFDRDWDWTIEKVADAVDLLLMPGQSFIVNYDVTVDPTATDSNFEVTGSITVANPSPEDVMTVDVTDMLSTGETLASTAIDCGAAGDGAGAMIAAGGSITCTYAFSGVTNVAAGDNGTNTATATFSNDADVAVSDTDDYSYALDSETDECIDVTDALGGIDTTVCAGDDPSNFEFEYTVDVGQEACGDFTVPNTASFATNDQDGEDDDTGSDSWLVTITIPCPEGCTLTQGYWKTHSAYGPAPTDEAWMDLPDVDGDGIVEGPDETFFLSGQTWYQVFWTKPAGNAYYILAKQYMAAVLNGVNDADTTEVNDELQAAEDLFESYDPDDIAILRGKKQPRPQFISLAGTLASYNEGEIGPGHCDEDGNSTTAP